MCTDFLEVMSAAPQERFARKLNILFQSAADARADRIHLENAKHVTQGYGLLGVGLAAPGKDVHVH